MSNIEKKNKRVATSVFLAVFFMIGLSFASVPLYDLFCRVTGFGGTTQVAAEAPGPSSERKITVNFNAEISRDLAWDFRPELRRVVVNPGQKIIASYRAQNKTTAPLAGTALYNVSPPKVGKYFHKIECFCFAEQILQPGEGVSMPVLFFVDPKIDEDESMNDVTTITLSYNFFKTETEELDQALEDFYNQDTAPAQHYAGDG